MGLEDPLDLIVRVLLEDLLEDLLDHLTVMDHHRVLDLWEDLPIMVPPQMVTPKEVHPQELCQHKDLDLAVLCPMEVHLICIIFKG